MASEPAMGSTPCQKGPTGEPLPPPVAPAIVPVLMEATATQECSANTAKNWPSTERFPPIKKGGRSNDQYSREDLHFTATHFFQSFFCFSTIESQIISLA